MFQRLPHALLAFAVATSCFTGLYGQDANAPAEASQPEDDTTATPQKLESPDGEQSAPKAEPAMDRTATLVASLTVFVLAVFVGFEIITKVPPTLHTPLMSGSNAVSGITLVGALLVTGGGAIGWSRTWGFLAVALATINVVGGFMVTHRMLSMFNKPRR